MSPNDLGDLTKLADDELLKLYGDLMKKAYQDARPIANEMERRYLEKKKENLKKAS